MEVSWRCSGHKSRQDSRPRGQETAEWLKERCSQAGMCQNLEAGGKAVQECKEMTSGEVNFSGSRDWGGGWRRGEMSLAASTALKALTKIPVSTRTICLCIPNLFPAPHLP